MNTILRLSGLYALVFLCFNANSQTCTFDPPTPEATTVVACNSSQTLITPATVLANDTVPACDLFISEYIEGSSNNKCVEIYNGTGSAIDLSNYELRIYFNGNTTFSDIKFPAQDLADGMTFVICNTSADMAFTSVADDLSGSIQFNGNDVIALAANGVLIDVIGEIGDDSNFAQNVTLVRNSLIQCGDADTSDVFDVTAEFTELATDVSTNLGMHDYAGEGFVPAMFNFYDADPNGTANLLAGPTDSYDPGGEATVFVTAVHEMCESDPVEVNVLVSTGEIVSMSCDSKINLSLGYDCTLDDRPQTYLEGDYDFEFFQVLFRDNVGRIIPKENVDQRYLGKTITYSVEDQCTGMSCWGKVTIDDKKDPQLTIRDTMILCGEPYGVDDLPPVVVEDCSDYTIFHNDKSSGSLCDGDRTITRHFTATDSEGNVGTATQVITIKSRSIDEITPPTPEVTTDCGIIEMDDIVTFTGNVEDGYPTIDGVPVVEGEFCNMSVWKEDKVIEACNESCSNSVKVIRTWNIIDWCEEVFAIHSYEQLISAKDTLPPTLPELDTVRISVDPWSCTADLSLPTGFGMDNCSDELFNQISAPSGIIIDQGVAKDLPLGYHTFTYWAYDCCENYSEPENLVVEVYDGVAPTAIAKEEIVLSLVAYGQEGDNEGIAKLFGESVNNESFDNCGDLTFLVKRENDPCQDNSDEWGEFVTFCCRDYEEEHKVELLVTDEAGNTSVTWANVKIEAKEVFIECKDIDLFCHDDIEAEISKEENKPHAYGLCRGEAVVEIDRDYSNYNSTCDFGQIYITYAVASNPNVTCVQTVNVNYKGGFSCENIHWPEAEKVVDCMDLPEPGLTYDVGPCELIGWTVESDTFSFNTNEACRKIVNDYIVVDWCVYDEGQDINDFPDYSKKGVICTGTDPEVDDTPGVYKFSQVIKIVDTVAPILANTRDWTYPIESDDCSINVKIDNSAYEPNECHNQKFYWQLDLDYDHDGNVDTSLFDSDQTDVWFMVPKTLYGPMDSVSAAWKVWDGCGNSVREEFKIYIVDKKAPIPYCVDLSSALMSNGMVELWAIDFDRNSEDNCYSQDELLFTFDEIPPDSNYLTEEHYFDENGIITDEEEAIAAYENGDAQLWLPGNRSSAMAFTCDDLPETTLKMTVWDPKFNYDFCTVRLTLSEQDEECDPAPAIAGNIYLEDFRAVKEVEVTLQEMSSGETTMQLTDNEGKHEFRRLKMNDNYLISPTKSGEIRNGVTTQDMLLIQQHIMRESEFDSPYKVVAGDVNDDQKLSATDLILIQRLSIGMTDNFAAGEWKFVEASQRLDIENALLDASYSKMITNIVKPEMDNDFIAVKIGDVNNDVALSSRDGLSPRSKQAVSLKIKDRQVAAGEEVTITLAINEEELLGYQMALTTDGIEVVHIHNLREDISPIVSRIIDNGVYLSYGNANLPTPSGDLFELTLRSSRDGRLSDMIHVSGEEIVSEVYLGDQVENYDVLLSFVQPENTFAEAQLTQNQPNPFSQETVIGFYLPEDGTAKVSVMAVDGKVLYQHRANYSKGTHQLTINREDLRQSGVFYYMLQYGNSILTKKMILIE